MRAVVTQLLPDRSREKVLVQNWSEPKGPANHQVRTQTVYSGITNGTERNDLIGGNYAHADELLPAGWGYQNVGRVVEVGSQVRGIQVGDLRYMSADHTEYVVMDADGLSVKVPEGVDPKHAALFGMASVAMRTCRNAQFQPRDRVLVVGAGVVGQVAAQIASAMGTRSTICDIDQRRLETAREIGAVEEALDVSGAGWEQTVPEAAYDVVMDFAGVPGAEDRLIAAARLRGQVLFIAGRSQVTYTFNLGQGREITIKQNSHFDNADLANVAQMVEQDQVRIGPLLQDVVPVTEAGAIYDRLRDDPNSLFGTVFVW